MGVILTVFMCIPLTQAWCREQAQRLRGFALRMSSKSSNSDDDEDESKDVAQNRESMSQLPFYRSDNGTRESEFVGITRAGQKEEDQSKNIYVNLLESLTPGEMVGQFMATAPPRVQTAVKNTVVGLLGSLRASTSFDASVPSLPIPIPPHPVSSHTQTASSHTCRD